MATPHGRLVAHDVGELVGVSGTTIGQWARRGYIRSSQRATEPRLYSVEDVAEAAIIRALLARGVRRRDIRRAVARLREAEGEWPLSRARLATVDRRLLLHDPDAGWLELGARGWQAVAAPAHPDEVRLRLGV
ncbi:MAG TPA: MerR family transcriptional regulator [Baekduia sp.]|nr:MerR family transcriptional regulator [Baekduia sp.]